MDRIRLAVSSDSSDSSQDEDEQGAAVGQTSKQQRRKQQKPSVKQQKPSVFQEVKGQIDEQGAAVAQTSEQQGGKQQKPSAKQQKPSVFQEVKVQIEEAKRADLPSTSSFSSSSGSDVVGFYNRAALPGLGSQHQESKKLTEESTATTAVNYGATLSTHHLDQENIDLNDISNDMKTIGDHNDKITKILLDMDAAVEDLEPGECDEDLQNWHEIRDGLLTEQQDLLDFKRKLGNMQDLDKEFEKIQKDNGDSLDRSKISFKKGIRQMGILRKGYQEEAYKKYILAEEKVKELVDLRTKNVLLESEEYSGLKKELKLTEEKLQHNEKLLKEFTQILTSLGLGLGNGEGSKSKA